MGFLRDLVYGVEPGPVVGRSAIVPTPAFAVAPREIDTTPDMGALIDAIIAQRVASFGLADALRMPAVIRAVQLLCSIIAQFSPVAYRGGVPLTDQPRICRQPAPVGTRNQFLYQTVYSWLAIAGPGGTGGDAYWYVTDYDELGKPAAMIVVDPGEVSIEWDAKRWLPVYTWRGATYGADPAISRLMHLTIGRPPGALHGRSPLIAGLDSLAVVDAAERYALGYFDTAGIPSAVLKAQGKLTETEALKAKAQWMTAHTAAEPTPAVLSAGWDVEFPNVDAQKAQLQESRAYGATIVARLLGIPAALLHVETSGATITYVNAGGALDELVRTCAQPVYLAPLEGYYSLLVPRTQTVRFDTGELYRADLAGRIAIYAQAIGAGVLAAPEARSFEGWPTDGPIEFVPSLEPTPSLPAIAEVPGRA